MTEETVIEEGCVPDEIIHEETYGLIVGAEFSTWAEFKTVMEQYEANVHVKLILADTRKVHTANVAYRREGAPLYDEKFKYAYARVTCKHHGKYRSKGSGKRPNQKSYKTNCPMHFILSVDRVKDKMFIRSGNFTHNHPTDEGVAKLYPENRRLSKSERQFSKILMDMKVPTKVFRERVREMSQKPLTNKDIYNLQAQLRREMAEEEKTEVQSLLHELQDITEKDAGSEVVVNVDGNGQIQVVFFQTSYMKETYIRFPEVCVIGDTDDVNTNGMILCTLIVQDGSGTYIPCAHFLLAKLDESTMSAAFQLFKQPLDPSVIEKTKLFIVGSNSLDIKVFESHFPNASIKLCETQVLKTFKNETSSMENGTAVAKSEKQGARRQNHLWTILHAMVMSKTEEEYYELLENLQSLAFAQAFNETWHKQRHLWVGAWRNKDLNYGIKTADSVEAFHGKVKNVVNGTSTVAECVRGIWKIDNQVKLESDHKKLKAMLSVKNPNQDKNPDLEELNKFCTSYAVSLTEKEIIAAAALDVQKDVGGQIIVTGTVGEFAVDEKGKMCSCTFYTNYNLPCRHIFAMRKFLEKEIFEESLFESRWQKDYQHSDCKIESVEVSSPSVSLAGKAIKRESQAKSSNTPVKKPKTDKPNKRSQSLTRDEKYTKATLLCRQIAGVISEVPQKQFENKMKILTTLCSHWLNGDEVKLTVKSKEPDDVVEDVE
ncbi:zinc finger SWIM domain-containing protein 1-like [Anneissia japonica]|uniref:zinc finger SWIM domain-containing protein 1-like n=1 Tax=Anneissia japonica TaxID=1529436 RepID=UPI001425B5E2|nr:zinc finger SWIM domain-containing protein 1-like [Anneissia japonica]